MRCTTLFVLCCFFSVFFAPSQSSNRDIFKPSCWKHCLVACRVHVRAGQRNIIRTAATLRMRASAGVDGRKCRLSVLLASAMPSGAARFTETMPSPLSIRSPLKETQKSNLAVSCDGYQANIGTQRGESTHTQHVKTSVHFESRRFFCERA